MRVVEKRRTFWDDTPAAEGGNVIRAEFIRPTGIKKIPPRPWAFGRYLLFGHTAVLGARDGGGKGAIACAMALSFITGTALLGERVWRTGAIAVISYEDDQDEWHRRLAAACLFHGLDYDTVVPSVTFLSLPDRKIVLASIREGRTIFPDGDDIISAINGAGAVLFIIDPFNHAHDLQDGNSNVLIAQVAAETERIARETGAAGLVLHHLRKGANGEPDDLMGATSLRATFRSARILARMDPKVAEGFSIPPDQAFRYIRIAGTKENYAPPPDKATWYRLNSVALGNGTDEYPDGDEVAAASRWCPPSPFEGLSWEAIFDVLEQVDRGMPDGERYSSARTGRASRWAGELLVARGRTADQASKIIEQWLEEGVLIKEPYESPRQRKTRDGLTVSAVKLTQMKAASAPPSDYSEE